MTCTLNAQITSGEQEYAGAKSACDVPAGHARCAPDIWCPHGRTFAACLAQQRHVSQARGAQPLSSCDAYHPPYGRDMPTLLREPPQAVGRRRTDDRNDRTCRKAIIRHCYHSGSSSHHLYPQAHLQKREARSVTLVPLRRDKPSSALRGRRRCPHLEQPADTLGRYQMACLLACHPKRLLQAQKRRKH